MGQPTYLEQVCGDDGVFSADELRLFGPASSLPGIVPFLMEGQQFICVGPSVRWQLLRALPAFPPSLAVRT